MEEHRARGHLVTIISASTPGVVGPVASHLGVKEYLCSRLEVADGSFTGKVIEPACYGAGKVYWAEQYASGHGASLGESHFYSDGFSDLPLLERVGHPVAVNPDRRLLGLARARGWPIERFY
jgi:putative phosphoserine phosphatase/1-acylglycerol-3-phosphate O-acyltransferase